MRGGVQPPIAGGCPARDSSTHTWWRDRVANVAPRAFPTSTAPGKLDDVRSLVINVVALVGLLAVTPVPAERETTAESTAPVVLVSAVYYDGYARGDADEAVQLWNVGAVAVDLTGWSVGDGQGAATFPAGASLAAGRWTWLARDAAAYRRSFGHWPDWSWSVGPGNDGPCPRLVTIGGGPQLGNDGDAVFLRGPGGWLADVLVYGDGPASNGWRGPAVRPYHRGAISGAHQVLYRKLDPTTGAPAGDTDRLSDWASDPADPLHGRRVRFPGWDLEANLRPRRIREAATIEVAVAPDALFDFLSRHFQSAQHSIDWFSYTFENADLAEVLVGRLQAGVRVRVLVDGSPAGGIDPNQRWCLDRIASAGGAVYWLDDGGAVRRRYKAAHAKLGVIDGETVLLGSENPSLGAAPSDDFGDGTAGRRGVFLAIDAPSLAGWARDLVARDLDPEGHADLRPFQRRDPQRGAPAPDFRPARSGGGEGYSPVAPDPLVAAGEFDLELLTAPENALAPDAGLLGLLSRTGDRGEVLAQQLKEPVWWGAGPEDGPTALNPRVQGYLSAARRGARVRLLLDGYFDDPADARGNAATVAYLNGLAESEGLDLAARLGNPAGRGLHNKMVLVSHGGEGLRIEATSHLPRAAVAAWDGGTEYWAHVGSLNGSEVASKANREVALQVESAAVYRYLARVFAWDWARSGANALWLPWVGKPSSSGDTPQASRPRAPTRPRPGTDSLDALILMGEAYPAVRACLRRSNHARAITRPPIQVSKPVQSAVPPVLGN